MYGLLFSLIPAVAVAIIGAVMAPKAGAAKGKMWLGLTLLIIGSVIGVIWQGLLLAPGISSAIWETGGAAAYGAISTVIGLVTAVFYILGVYFLCSAVVMGRQEVAYLDPTRPGAPPTGYQGSGYQAGGQQPQQRPGSNPYT